MRKLINNWPGILNWLWIFILVLLTLAISGCSSLSGRRAEKLPEPDRIIFRCNGVEYSSDGQFIRAMGSGTSRNESTAARMAGLDASVNLARAIKNYEEKITAFRDKRQVKRGEAAVEWEEGTLTREQINMTLSNVSTICSETKTDGEMYITIQIVEVPIHQVIPSR